MLPKGHMKVKTQLVMILKFLAEFWHYNRDYITNFEA